MKRSAVSVPGPRGIAAIYALFAVLALLLLAPAMPPFQNADEPAHFLRADAISHGELLAWRFPDRLVGGYVDAGAVQALAPFAAMPFHPERKATRAMYAPRPWGGMAEGVFSNTAVYPPFFYLPAASGIVLARHLQLPVLHGVLLARLFGGAATIAIGAAAIALAEDAAPWLFAILLLPMSMALTAALSQDAPMLACTALGVAFCLRLANAPQRRAAWLLAGACAMLAMAAMARPPYAAFALIVLALPVRISWRWAGFAVILICTLAWAAANAHAVAMPHFPQGSPDPYRQAMRLLHHPARLGPLMCRTWVMFHHVWFQGFIGNPGSQDVDLPDSFRKLALAMLGVAAFASLAGKPRAAMLGAVAAALCGTVIGIAAIQYLTWNLVGADAIDGIQGRYFLAPALLVGCVLHGTAMIVRRAPLLAWPLLVFPVLSLAVLMHAVIVRYYFT